MLPKLKLALCFSTLLLASSCNFGHAQDPQASKDDAAPTNKPTAAQIQSAIELLGSRDFSQRESARDRLWHLGDAAREALETAADSDNLEVAFRAKKLLEQLELGIRPDTSMEHINLIKRYFKGSSEEKRQVADALLKQENIDLVLKLIKLEKNKLQKDVVANAILDRSSSLATKLINANKFETAEELLQLGIGRERDVKGALTKEYAIFLAIQNRLDERIKIASEMLADFDETTENKSTQYEQLQNRLMLGRLLFYNGEIKEAADHATAMIEWEKSTEHPILLESAKTLRKSCETKTHNWQALASRPFYEGVCKLGLLAVFYRCDGDTEKFQATLKEILDDHKPSFARGEALMLSRQWEQAIENFAATSQLYKAVELSRLLCEHESGLKLVGLGNPRGRSAAWFNESMTAVETRALREANAKAKEGAAIKKAVEEDEEKETGNDAQAPMKEQVAVDEPDYLFAKDKLSQIRVALQVADTLCEFGETNEATILLNEIAKSDFSKQGLGPLYPRLLRIERDRSRNSLLETHLVHYFQKYPYQEKAWQESLPSSGIRDAAKAAGVWMKVLAENEKLQGTDVNREHVGKILRLYSTNRFPLVQKPEMKSLAEQYISWQDRSNIKNEALAINLAHLARLCDQHGHPEMAIGYFKNAVTAHRARKNFLNLADQLRKMERWEEASLTYELMYQANMSLRMERLLAGYCEIKAGEELIAQNSDSDQKDPALARQANTMIEHGKQTMQLADLSLLYDTRNRLSIARAFADRDLKELRLVQLHRIIDFQNARPINFVAGGTLASLDDEMDIGERLFLVDIGQACINHPSSWYQFTNGYTQTGANNEHMRARHYLEQNDIPSAIASAEDCRIAGPLNAKYAAKLVKEFEKAGEAEAAGMIFQSYFDFIESKAKKYPKSRQFALSLCKLCHLSDRELERGLEFANAAAALPIKTADVYLSLAQVHFALGNKAKADDALEQAFELAPNSEELKKAKEKFKGQQSDLE